MAKVEENRNKKWASDLVLTDQVVRLMPIVSPGGMFKDPNHDGAFMYTGTIKRFVLPKRINGGGFPIILNSEEREAFEMLLDVDLNPYKKEDNFWSLFEIKIRKDETLMAQGFKLDLRDPLDALRYKMLAFIPEIAPSWEERWDSAEYSFAVVDEEEREITRARKADNRKRAYMFMGKIENSKTKMTDFLRVYGERPANDARVNFLKGAIDDLIENPKTLSKVLAIIDDPNYEMKLFIEDAVECQAIERKNKKYYLPGGDAINASNPTLDGTIEKLKQYKKETDDVFLGIQARITNAK